MVGLGKTEVRWIASGEIGHEGESAGAFWFRDGKVIAWQPFGAEYQQALVSAAIGEALRLRSDLSRRQYG